MKILILTNSDPYKTAGVVAYNLFDGLKKRGHYTKMIVKTYGNYKNNDIVNIQKKSDVIIHKIKNKLKKIITKLFHIKKTVQPLKDHYGFHDFDHTKQYYKTEDVLKYIDFKPDIILYLFPQRFLNSQNLYELNKFTDAPIFWYLMDFAALTGGCHYFWNCKKYLTGCGKCPAMYSADENDQSAINFKFKYEFLGKTDIDIIVGTEEMVKQTKASLMYKNKQVHKILLPVDSKIFKPVSKSMVRSALSLPKNKKIIFIGSSFLNEKRKGMRYLVDALNLIKDQKIDIDIMLLVAGRNFDYIKDDLPFDFKYLGMLENDDELASAFQVSDIFISSSIQDAGPLMINQSIMSGTPVVSFEMGVANDLVIDGETGYLAELKNTKELAKRIIDITSLGDDELEKMSKNCRELGLKLLDQNVFVNEFEKIFVDKRNKNKQ